jgi:hypothetical protein
VPARQPACSILYLNETHIPINDAYRFIPKRENGKGARHAYTLARALHALVLSSYWPYRRIGSITALDYLPHWLYRRTPSHTVSTLLPDFACLDFNQEIEAVPNFLSRQWCSKLIRPKVNSLHRMRSFRSLDEVNHHIRKLSRFERVSYIAFSGLPS